MVIVVLGIANPMKLRVYNRVVLSAPHGVTPHPHVVYWYVPGVYVACVLRSTFSSPCLQLHRFSAKYTQGMGSLTLSLFPLFFHICSGRLVLLYFVLVIVFVLFCYLFLLLLSFVCFDAYSNYYTIYEVSYFRVCRKNTLSR